MPHDLSTETMLARYSLRGALAEPISATMMVGAMVGGTLLSAAGSAVQAGGQLAAGDAAETAGQLGKQQKEFEAKQAEQQAMATRASAQRKAFERGRETSLLSSTLQARAASGGGGATDETIQNLGGKLAARGKYAALEDIFAGDYTAGGLMDAAMADRLSGDALEWEGKVKKSASRTAALGTVLGGLGSSMKSFGMPTGKAA